MSKAQEFLQKRAKLLDDADALVTKAATEKRDLTDDETGQIEKWTDEADGLKAQADGEARRTNVRERLSTARSTLGQPRGTKTTEPSGAAPLGTVSTSPAFMADPKRGYKRAADFYRDVIRAERAGRVSEQLESLRADAGSDEASENSDASFLVPTGFSPNLLKLEAEDDPTATLVSPLPMETPSVEIPCRVDKNHSTSVSGGFQVFRRAHTQAVDPKKPAFEKIVYKADSLFGVSIAEEELLADSPLSYAALLDICAREEMASKLLDEKIDGTGAGEFLGVLKSPCLVTVDAEVGQDADTVTYTNVVAMRARCWKYAKSIWLANHDVLPTLMKMNQAVGVGGQPAWQPSAREDRPDILLGRPIHFIESCKKVGDVGDLILGNWSQYLLGALENLKSADSAHVRFLNHERTFKFWMRNAGAPWWRSPLTPKNSSPTLSPFVVLAAR